MAQENSSARGAVAYVVSSLSRSELVQALIEPAGIACTEACGTWLLFSAYLCCLVHDNAHIDGASS